MQILLFGKRLNANETVLGQGDTAVYLLSHCTEVVGCHPQLRRQMHLSERLECRPHPLQMVDQECRSPDFLQILEELLLQG